MKTTKPKNNTQEQTFEQFSNRMTALLKDKWSLLSPKTKEYFANANVDPKPQIARSSVMAYYQSAESLEIETRIDFSVLLSSLIPGATQREKF